MQLYIYDHCPYCVRARMIFGLKKIPVQLITLLNDDEATPTKLVGKKVVPILVKDNGEAMPESLDIVHYIDKHYGNAPILTGQKDDPALLAWIEASRDYTRRLCMPRWVDAPLAEYQSESARLYFIKKKEENIGSFQENLKLSRHLIATASEHLRKLEPLVKSPQAIHGTLSEDDILLFPILRSLTIVAGLRFPDKVDTYVRRMSEITGIPLHLNIAC